MPVPCADAYWDQRFWPGRDEPLRGPPELRVQVGADLAAGGHQREAVTAAVLIGGRGPVRRVPDGQRLEPDEGSFKYRDVDVHVRLLIAPGVGTLRVAGCRTFAGPGPSGPLDE